MDNMMLGILVVTIILDSITILIIPPYFWGFYNDHLFVNKDVDELDEWVKKIYIRHNIYILLQQVFWIIMLILNLITMVIVVVMFVDLIASYDEISRYIKSLS